MEQQSSQIHKDISLKFWIKTHRLKEPNVSSSSTCSECSMSFSSSKALFGHLRIHSKKNKRGGKSSLTPLRQSEEFVAACILMEMSRSKSEADIDAAKLCKLRWVCDKIARQRKKMTEVATPMGGLEDESVSRCNASSGDEKANVGGVEETAALSMLSAVGAAEAAVHRCDKCDKVFNSGQALGGHKRAHYNGPPLCRLGNDGVSKVVVAPAEVVVFDFDLNEPAEEGFI